MTREQYNKIFNNGQAHIDASKILANNGDYGFAISHLILGIEELIKYQIVYTNICSEDQVFTNNEFNDVFYKHRTKHSLLEEFQKAISSEFSEDFIESVFYEFAGRELEEKHKKVRANRFKEMGSFMAIAYSEINISENEKENFFNWLNQANELKNRGFYVDRIDRILQSPEDISKEEFELAFKYANAILKQTEVIKQLDITDEEFMAMLNGTGFQDD